MVNEMINILEQFRTKKILVIGDIMLDKYIWGKVSRISPEAPVQIVNVERESYAPGGAANVANNAAALGAGTYIASIIGNDIAKNILVSELKNRSINTDGIIEDPTKPTIQKVRVIGQNQQLLRIDYEKRGYINADIEKNLINYLSRMIPAVDAVIISDYSKGVITRNIAMKVTDMARRYNRILVIDPKPEHKDFYKNVSLITPNNHEASEMAGINGDDDETIIEIGKKLLKEMNSALLITRGEKGMTIFELNGSITHIPTVAKEVYDVTGAGDTVVATGTLALSSGAGIIDAAKLANNAAGIVVGKIGTSTVSIEELKNGILNDK